MIRWMNICTGFAADQEGATAPEYAVMLAMVLGVVILTVVFLGIEVEQLFNDFAVLFDNASN